MIKPQPGLTHDASGKVIKKLKNNKWSLTYICSSITADRTYVACARSDLEPWQPEVIRGNLVANNRSRQLLTEEKQQIEVLALNPGQKKALSAGLALQQGCISIVGSPGTGKSTVVTDLLGQLHRYYQTQKDSFPIGVCAASNKALQDDAAKLIQKYPGIAVTLFVTDEVAALPELKDSSYVWSPNSWAKRQQNIFKVIKAELVSSDGHNQGRDRLDNFIHQLGHEDYNFAKEELIKNLKSCLKQRGDPQIILGLLKNGAEDFISQYLADISIRKLEEALRNSEIIFGTMASFANRYVRKIRVKTLVVEEAGQATEALLQVPLKAVNPSAVILVGDPKQLPATVLSRKAKKLGFTRSTLERFAAMGVACYSLPEQYRMKPGISAMADGFFPDAKIVDSELVKARSLPARLKYDISGKGIFSAEKHYVFIDADKGVEKTVNERGMKNPSHGNAEEAKLVVDIYEAYQKHSYLETAPQITILTPYQGQIDLIQKEFAKRKFAGPLPKITTVDGYQGGENEVIIASMVRGGKEGSVGFLEDQQRLFVMASRAKSKLIVVGNRKTLQQHTVLANLVKDKQHHNQLFCNQAGLQHDLGLLEKAVKNSVSSRPPAASVAASQGKWMRDPSIASAPIPSHHSKCHTRS